MHVNARRISFLGLLLAVTVLLVILGGVIETSTLFFLAGASFCVGIAIRECGLRLGTGFYIAGVLLSFLLAPNKFYCITFAGMGLYILVEEFIFERMTMVTSIKHRIFLYWVAKYILFNLMYLPALFLLPKLIYPGTINRWILLGLIAGGQAGLFVFDMAYGYFQKNIWGKFRGKFKIM